MPMLHCHMHAYVHSRTHSGSLSLLLFSETGIMRHTSIGTGGLVAGPGVDVCAEAANHLHIAWLAARGTICWSS